METENPSYEVLKDLICEPHHDNFTESNRRHDKLLDEKYELDYKLTKLIREFEITHGYGVEIEVIKSDCNALATQNVRTKLTIW